MFSSPTNPKVLAPHVKGYSIPPTPPPTSPVRSSNGATKVRPDQICTGHATDTPQPPIQHTSEDLDTSSLACSPPRPAQNSIFQRGIWPSVATQQDPELKRGFLDVKNSHLGGGYIFQALRTQDMIAQSDGSAVSQQRHVAALVEKTARASAVPVSPKKQRNVVRLVPTLQVIARPAAPRLWIHTLRKGNKKDLRRAEQLKVGRAPSMA